MSNWQPRDQASLIKDMLKRIGLLERRPGARNDQSGAVSLFAGPQAPGGTLFAQGQTLSRDEYPALFAAIGTTYGAPSGSTFTIPNLAPVGGVRYIIKW